jgi:hypothetical protein
LGIFDHTKRQYSQKETDEGATAKGIKPASKWCGSRLEEALLTSSAARLWIVNSTASEERIIKQESNPDEPAR